jgi:phosphohistidine phosphatase
LRVHQEIVRSRLNSQANRSHPERKEAALYRLYLLRHAEASRGKPGGADFDRPLSERGRRDAAALGTRMHAAGYRPAFVLCSGALRARETWSLVAHALGEPRAGEMFMRELYRGDATDYRNLIGAAPAGGPLLVVGHNPMIGEFAATFVRSGDPAALSIVSSGFPPGGLAVVDFAVPLSRIAPRTGTLSAFFRPER